MRQDLRRRLEKLEYRLQKPPECIMQVTDFPTDELTAGDRILISADYAPQGLSVYMIIRLPPESDDPQAVVVGDRDLDEIVLDFHKECKVRMQDCVIANTG